MLKLDNNSIKIKHDGERRPSAALNTQHALREARQSQPVPDAMNQEHICAENLLHSAVAIDQTSYRESQPWHEPVLSPRSYAAPDGLPQPQSNPETPEELNLAPALNAAPPATPTKKRKYTMDTLANWRDELDPVKRRRLANNYNRLRSEARRQAQVDAQNRAFVEMALEMQRAAEAMDLVSPFYRG